MPSSEKTASPVEYSYSTVREAQRSPDTVTINIHLPRELHRLLRVKSLNEDLTLTQAVIAAIGEWVA
jgi:hypothetical protein